MRIYRIIRVIGDKKEVIAINLTYDEAKKYEILYANVYKEHTDNCEYIKLMEDE